MGAFWAMDSLIYSLSPMGERVRVRGNSISFPFPNDEW